MQRFWLQLRTIAISSVFWAGLSTSSTCESFAASMRPAPEPGEQPESALAYLFRYYRCNSNSILDAYHTWIEVVTITFQGSTIVNKDTLSYPLEADKRNAGKACTLFGSTSDKTKAEEIDQKIAGYGNPFATSPFLESCLQIATPVTGAANIISIGYIPGGRRCAVHADALQALIQQVLGP